MGEILQSRCLQMLADLAVDGKDACDCGMNEDEVKFFLSWLGKIEVLLENGDNSGNFPLLLNRIYIMEDVLETWAVDVEVANMRSKKRGIRSLLARFVCGRNDGMKNNTSFLIYYKMEANHMIKNLLLHERLHDDAMESLRSVDEDQTVADWRSVPWPRQTYANGMVEHFVGMDEDLKQLVFVLVDEDKKQPHHPVVSVCGVGGLGKTTLARKVYIHPEVRTHFKAFAWLSLGQDYEFGNLLENLLKQLSAAKKNAEEQKKGAEEKKKNAENQKKGVDEEKRNAEEQNKGVSDEKQKEGVEEKKKRAEEQKKSAEEQKKSSEENMIDQLKETQRQKKCFIVIDGILEMRQWEQISSAFLLAEGTNTKILLTTRDEAIAGVGSRYTLKLLDVDKGWELLQKYVFRGRKAPDLGIVPKLGKEFVQKCGNLPSAISSLGRALSKIPLSEWHTVIADVTGYLQRDNRSQSDERSDDVSDPRYYDDIPFHLKQCFLYLGIFKEDKDVDSDDLTLLWMAEGMLSLPSDKDGMIMEDRAEDYLRKLAGRDMLQVQVDELSASRRFMRLCLRNQVRELALYQGEKEDFRLKVMDFSDGEQPRFDSFVLYDGTRRLVIHFNKLVDSERLNETDDLRSLFFLNSGRDYVDLPVRIFDFGEFKLLRVVHFVRCKFEGRKLPEGIEKLVNLRYLGILYCDLEKLPASISNLRNLYVLNVRANDDAKITIPNVISNMVRLKHLRLPNNLDHELPEKLKLDGLHDLETLVGFNADIHDIDSLSELKKLRLLVTHAYSNDSLKSIVNFFKDKGAGMAMETNLFIEYKCNLTSAEGSAILEEVLMCPNLFALTFSMVLIHKFPNCGMYESEELTQIKLIGCKLGEDPMKALGTFPKLRKLCLGYGAFVGKKMAIDSSDFPSLEYLEFRCLPNLEEWSVGVGGMQRLSTLTVRQCPKLKTIPTGLTSVSSLKNMEIELATTDELFLDKKAEYDEMFALVKSRIIRKINLDHLSASNDSAH